MNYLVFTVRVVLRAAGWLSGRFQQVAPFLAAALLVAATCTSAVGQTPPRIQVGRLRVELDRIANRVPNTTIQWPVFLDTEGNGSGRLYIAEQFGRIRVLDNGAWNTFLDLQSEVYTPGPVGILGFTFHPGYNDPMSPGYRKLYTFHSVAVPEEPVAVDFTSPGTVDHHNVVTEWQVDANNPKLVDLSTRREVFRQAHVHLEHSGGMLTFGPDGYLYGTIGTPRQAAPMLLQSQDPTLINGKIFRIDPVDPGATPDSTDAVSANGKYRIPGDNPFVDDPMALDEMYALGVRNPYRFSIDPVSGLLFAGDVGRFLREELSVIPAGGNMGWPYYEGGTNGPVAPPNPPPDVVGPIAEYNHQDGRAIIGGYVYRGSIPELQGKYIFGELSWGPTSTQFNQRPGRLLWVDPFDENGDLKDPSEMEIQEMYVGPQTCAQTINSSGGCYHDSNILSFGVDDDGELYVMGVRAGNGNSVYKFASAQLLPEGDYNEDGTVDAADYTMWRDTLGQSLFRSPPDEELEAFGSGADGDGSGIVDMGDYQVWLEHFGETINGAGSAGGGFAPVPEPLTATMLIIALLGCSLFPRRSRRR